MRHYSLRFIFIPLALSISIVAIAGWFSACRKFTGKSVVTEDTNKVIVLSKPCFLEPSKNKIDASEAVRLAECFVSLNGYTDFRPMSDKSKLSYESWADGPPAEEALARRKNTLLRKAYGVREGRGRLGDVKDGWTIAFRYNPDNLYFRSFMPDYDEYVQLRVRAVTMDAYGGKMKVEHEDYNLTAFQQITELSR